MHTLQGMGSLVLVFAALMSSSTPATRVPEGCEKRCVKQYVACKDARVEDQMLCMEVVRRCEVHCPGQQRPVRKAEGRAKQ